MLDCIDRSRYVPLPIYISKCGDWLISQNEKLKIKDFEKASDSLLHVSPMSVNGVGRLLTERAEIIDVYCALPLLHGDFGEDGTVQGALECARIPYIGCDTGASSVAIDKVYTKIIAQNAKIPTARWICARRGEMERARALSNDTMGMPIFIKPARLGSSIGACAVRSHDEFDSAFDAAASLDQKILIEEFVEIEAELECAYFATKSKELFTNIGEIRYNSDFYDYDTKYKNTSDVTLSVHSDYQALFGEKIIEYSRRLVSLIGIRDIARIDFFVSRGGELLFNEINTMPGFTCGSLYPSLLEASAISVTEAISELAENAAFRE